MALLVGLTGASGRRYVFEMTQRPGEQPTNIANIAAFAMSRPASIKVLFQKVWKRVRDSRERPVDLDWIDRHSVDPTSLAKRLDASLWEEAQAYGSDARQKAARILAEVPFDMGAGGEYELLYWLTRYLRPTAVVETGVSAGWSSRAILTALKRNQAGRLYSSDFPYFRVHDPVRYIGILVEEELKKNWTLHTVGDADALPMILAEAGPIGLFHYDSDKSFSGRQFAIEAVRRQLTPDGVILVDDTRNDSWYQHYTDTSGLPAKVFYGRCGVIDPAGRLAPD